MAHFDVVDTAWQQGSAAEFETTLARLEGLVNGKVVLGRLECREGGRDGGVVEY